MITRLKSIGFFALLLVLLRPQLGIQQWTGTDVPRRTPKGLTHLDRHQALQISSDPLRALILNASLGFTLMFALSFKTN